MKCKERLNFTYTPPPFLETGLLIFSSVCFVLSFLGVGEWVDCCVVGGVGVLFCFVVSFLACRGGKYMHDSLTPPPPLNCFLRACVLQ
jgi:hypothetical protein